MSFSATFQWIPGDDDGLRRFLLDHYVRHRLYIDALLGQTPPFRAVDLPIQTLDKWADWLAAHQQMSQSAWTGAGGGQSTDFGTLNPKDSNALQDWQFYHRAWHQQMDAALGL